MATVNDPVAPGAGGGMGGNGGVGGTNVGGNGGLGHGHHHGMKGGNAPLGGGGRRRGWGGGGRFMGLQQVERQEDFTAALTTIGVVNALIAVFFFLAISLESGGNSGYGLDGTNHVQKAWVALSALGYAFAMSALAVVGAALLSIGKPRWRGGYVFWGTVFTAISLVCSVIVLCLVYQATHTHNRRLFICLLTIPAGLISIIFFWVGLFNMCMPGGHGRRKAAEADAAATV